MECSNNYYGFGVTNNYPIQDEPIKNEEKKCSSLENLINKIKNFVYSLFKLHKYRHNFQPTPGTKLLGVFTETDLRLSNNAKDSFEWKMEIIRNAKKSIELSGNFAGGAKFREVLDLIETRLEKCPELKCHLILSRDLLDAKDLNKLDELSKKYPDRFQHLITDRIYTPLPSPRSEENHVKLLVVDEKYFVTGGTGIHKKMAREELDRSRDVKKRINISVIDRAFRDSDIIGAGDVAVSMRQQFFELYKIWEYRMTGVEKSRYHAIDGPRGYCIKFHNQRGLFEKSKLKFIVGGPEHRNNNPITREYVHLINKSKKDVQMGNLLFNPDKPIRQALKEKKNEGVPVTAYVNGTGGGSPAAHYIYALPNRYNYDIVTDAYEYQTPDQLYHKKVATFDGETTLIGSYNLGVKSAICDYETVCVIEDERVTRVMNEVFQEDAKRSKHLEGETLASKRRWNRIRGTLTIGLLGSFFG